MSSRETLIDLAAMLSLLGPPPTKNNTISKLEDVNKSQCAIVYEPTNLNEAIELYSARIKCLEAVTKQGFETIAEYNSYKRAKETINNMEEKIRTRKEEKTTTSESTEETTNNDDSSATTENSEEPRSN